ncbi:STAS domain-containing protein [Thiomicrorhabdus chilensis]|uniref:STAS domain-containing protein n=1 Tax=Thiomicrorhabdus chilensis TaxID=63656 RepID=UPI00040D7A3F|nr:STAS domain-containing protein [Thiomicrorhabdus chilensis]
MSDTITLPESLTIHTIDSTYTELNQAFLNTGDNIVLNAQAIETIDTSGLQALLMLIESARKNQKSIEWQNANELLKTSAEKIGLAQALQLN